MQSPDNIELLDAVYFAAIQRRAVKALRESAHSVRYARMEIEVTLEFSTVETVSKRSGDEA